MAYQLRVGSGIILTASYSSTAAIQSDYFQQRAGSERVCFFVHTTQPGTLSYRVRLSDGSDTEFASQAVTAFDSQSYAWNAPGWFVTFTPTDATPGTIHIEARS